MRALRTNTDTQGARCQFWNYSKTPARGVREVEVCLDGALLYRGWLQQSSETEAQAQAVVFSANKVLTQQLAGQVRARLRCGQRHRCACRCVCALTPAPPRQVTYCGRSEQAVTFVNDAVVVEQPAQRDLPDLATAAIIAAAGAVRPGTALLPR